MILPTQFASSSVVEKALNPPLFAIFDLFPTHPPPSFDNNAKGFFSTCPAPRGEFVLSDGSHPVVWPRRITGTVGRWVGLRWKEGPCTL